MEAIWLGSATGTIGGTHSNAFTGYEAYFAGSISEIDFAQEGGSVDFNELSYGIGYVF